MLSETAFPYEIAANLAAPVRYFTTRLDKIEGNCASERTAELLRSSERRNQRCRGGHETVGVGFSSCSVGSRYANRHFSHEWFGRFAVHFARFARVA